MYMYVYVLYLPVYMLYVCVCGSPEWKNGFADFCEFKLPISQSIFIMLAILLATIPMAIDCRATFNMLKLWVDLLIR